MDKYQLTFQSWDKFAVKYRDIFMDVDLYNDTFDIFCSLLNKENSSILEIGCGPGNITRYLFSKRPDFKILATDVSSNMIELGKFHNPEVEFKLLDAREVNRLEVKFDGIMCGFCMPYLSKDDCKKLIRDCAVLLNPGGVAYFSTMEDDNTKSGLRTGSDGVTQMFMNYHEENYLRNFFEENNLEIIELIRKVSTNTDGSLADDIIFIVKKV